MGGSGGLGGLGGLGRLIGLGGLEGVGGVGGSGGLGFSLIFDSFSLIFPGCSTIVKEFHLFSHDVH